MNEDDYYLHYRWRVIMKTMSCRQLGGACDEQFHASSFDEIAQMSRKHGMAKFEQKDEAHLNAMQEMQEAMRAPTAMKAWFEDKRKQFEALPED